MHTRAGAMLMRVGAAILVACTFHLRAVEAGGPQDMANPDCSAETHTAPAECVTDTTMAAYRAIAQFYEDNPGPEPPTGHASCEELYDGSAAKCEPVSGCTATNPTAMGDMGPDSMFCAIFDNPEMMGNNAGNEDMCNGGCFPHPAYGTLCAVAGCEFHRPDPACATVTLDGNPATCTNAGACNYVDGVDMNQFCTELKYVDTRAMQDWRAGQSASGTTTDDITRKQSAVADVLVGDYCPLFCDRCESHNSEPWPTCIDDPVGFFSAEEYYWPPPDCQMFVQMMGGLSACDTVVEEVSRFYGMTLSEMCPVSCETCPEPPRAELACEACAPGKWASDIPTWSDTLFAGIRSECQECPVGMYRSFTDATGMANTRCGSCPIGRFGNITGASSIAHCEDCQPPGCLYYDPDYPLKLAFQATPWQVKFPILLETCFRKLSVTSLIAVCAPDA